MSIRLRLPGYHPGQMKVHSEARRFNVLACGRRWGKDTFMMNKLIEPAVSGSPTAWGAPSYKVLSENWRVVNNLAAPLIAARNAQEKQLTLLTGGVIDFWSLDNPDAIRGRKYRRFIVNEAGFAPALMDTWNFIIRPTLVDLTGDAFIGGTPKGRNGFHYLYQYGVEGENGWRSWQMSSYDNPFVPRAELDEMVKHMPERVAQQEVFAQFLDDAGGVFRRVMDAAIAQEQEQPTPGHEYIFGVDWARTNDATVFAVLDVTESAIVSIDRMTDTDYNLQRMRLKALAERFRPYSIIAEYNAMGGPMVEQLQSDGLPVTGFTTTNASKQQIIDGLALAFEQSSIKIIPDPQLIAELQAFEISRTPAGMMRYAAPEGLHDDQVMATALAWYGVNGSNWWMS